MPVITLAGSEENSMGRGALDQPGRRRLFEVRPSDPVEGDEPLMIDEAPPRGCPRGG